MRREFVKCSCRLLLLAALLSSDAIFILSCAGEKKEAPGEKGEQVPSLAGRWRSDIESPDRTISRSYYTILQARDSISIKLSSNLSPLGDELVPEKMSFEASGTWKNKMLRLKATYWVSGKDSCLFDLDGALDPEGNLLLFFPGNLCGERNLPFTRKLVYLEQEEE